MEKRVSSSHRFTHEEFSSIYERVPRVCVDVLVKTPEGILLTKRDIAPQKGYWHLPGGTIYLGESLKEAVKRISQEELNLDVKILDHIGPMEFLHHTRDNGQKHAISIAYTVKAKDIGALKLNEQGKEDRKSVV